MTLELNFEMLLFNVDGDVPERDKKELQLSSLSLSPNHSIGADTQMMV